MARVITGKLPSKFASVASHTYRRTLTWPRSHLLVFSTSYKASQITTHIHSSIISKPKTYLLAFLRAYRFKLILAASSEHMIILLFHAPGIDHQSTSAPPQKSTYGQWSQIWIILRVASASTQNAVLDPILSHNRPGLYVSPWFSSLYPLTRLEPSAVCKLRTRSSASWDRVCLWVVTVWMAHGRRGNVQCRVDSHEIASS